MRRIVIYAVFAAIAAIATAACAADLPRGLWQSLVKPGAKWTLPITDKSQQEFDKVVIQVQEVRKVGPADVARLAWSALKAGKPVAADLHQLPIQVALTDKGVYLFGEAVKDAKIAAALKKKPTFAEPAKQAKVYSRKDGHFAFEPADRKGALCVGFGADDPTCGAAPCYQWMCLDATGIAGVGGLGPDGDAFNFGFVPARFPGD